MNNGFPPYPSPGPFDPNGPMRNPGMTTPFPQPSDVPEPGQFSHPIELTWVPATAPDDSTAPFFEAIWFGPTFDLRPNFRGVPTATTQTVGTQAIWRSLGAGGQFFVRVDAWNLLGVNAVDFNIQAWDMAHPFEILSMVQVTQAQDVTTQFTTALTGTTWGGLGVFTPSGGASPARFWRMKLRFQIGGVTGTLPKIRIAAAYY